MNYMKKYKLLIEKAKRRENKDSCYYEKHHVIPKSLGGSNEEENIVKLTAREHYIAHWLLYKMARNSNEKRILGFGFFHDV